MLTECQRISFWNLSECEFVCTHVTPVAMMNTRSPPPPLPTSHHENANGLLGPHYPSHGHFFHTSLIKGKMLSALIVVALASTLVTMTSASTSHINNGDEIPSVKHWPHRPIYLKAGDETTVFGIPDDEALPLGVPIEFETELFKGKLLVRLRNVKTDDPASHDAYFRGRSRVMQTVVQGRFKKPVNMADVFVGSLFKQPMKLVPPPVFMRLLNTLFQRIAPGAILDFASSKPKVVTLYAGTAQTISIDVPGEEPNITAVDLPEDVSRRFGTKFKSIKERKRKLSAPHKAARYEFDTEHVYTLQIYDESMDFGTYNIKLPVYGKFNFSQALGPQPMSLSAVTTSGEVVYNFDVWHESVYRLKYHI
jgi:Protein of unknown function (DUF1769)